MFCAATLKPPTELPHVGGRELAYPCGPLHREREWPHLGYTLSSHPQNRAHTHPKLPGNASTAPRQVRFQQTTVLRPLEILEANRRRLSPRVSDRIQGRQPIIPRTCISTPTSCSKAIPVRRPLPRSSPGSGQTCTHEAARSRRGVRYLRAVSELS